MYMGELTRQVLVDMVWEGLMFENIDTGNLWWHYNSMNLDTDTDFFIFQIHYLNGVISQQDSFQK